MTCAACRTIVNDRIGAGMQIHLAEKHPGALQIGEIVWLNKHEAVYGGRYYKPDGPRPSFRRAQGTLVNS